MRRPRPAVWLELAAAALFGAVQTLAFVHTSAWPLPLAAVGWLAWRAGAARPGQAAALGLAFGAAWLGSGVWWLFISLHRFGGLPAPLAVAAVAALSLALSLYLAVAMAAYARWRCHQVAVDVPLFAALWLVAELARGLIFTGFPWIASGYAQLDGPLAALAPWVGVYGMGAVLAALAAALASGWRSALGACVALALLAWSPAVEFSRSTGTLTVALLQGNVSQDQKFSLEHLPAALNWVGTTMKAQDAAFVLAPETAVPLLPDQLADFSPGYWDSLSEHFTRPGRAALLGVPLGDFDRGYTNSVVGWSAGPAYRYDKHHLVPFGEFVPSGFRWFTEMMNIPLGDFNRGAVVQPSFAVGAQRVAPNICYEDLFGEELARRFADAATAPTMFANVSNIGWFGRTIAIDQHLHISRLRSIEFQRPMLRATNTGPTAVIDHRGRVTFSLAPHTRGVLVAEVEGRDGLTPYARWAGRWGLWPLAALVLAGLWPAWRARRPGQGAIGP